MNVNFSVQSGMICTSQTLVHNIYKLVYMQASIIDTVLILAETSHRHPKSETFFLVCYESYWTKTRIREK